MTRFAVPGSIGAVLLAALAPIDAIAQAGTSFERLDERAPATLAVGPIVEYSSGKYGGAQSTDIWSVGATGRYERGPWVLRATVPFVHVTGPGNVVPTGGGTPLCRETGAGQGSNAGARCIGGATGSTVTRFSESGLGDVTAALGYKLLDGAETAVDVTAKVKFPTADESRGLGTGEFDYSLQGDVNQAFGRTNLFATVGYRWYGDPAGLDIKDGFFGGIGALIAVASGTSIGAAYDHREPTYDGGPSLDEISLLASFRLSPSARLRGYLFKGISDGGPDWGAGLSALFRF